MSDSGLEDNIFEIVAVAVIGVVAFVLFMACCLNGNKTTQQSTSNVRPPEADFFGPRRPRDPYWDPPWSQPPPTTPVRPYRPSLSTTMTTTTTTTNRHNLMPATGGTTASSPSRPPTNGNSTRQPLSPHQQAVNLVKSMTPSERRDYVANFLCTQKYAEHSESTTETMTSSGNPAQFIVSQSTRNLNPQASEQAAASCAICLNEFDDGEDICSSQNEHCPHQFHLACAFEWLLSSPECPCCRRDYLTIGQVLSSRRLAAPTQTETASSSLSTPNTSTTAALPEMAPTAPTESDLPSEAELPVESEAEILPVAADAAAAPSGDSRVENALTPQAITSRSVLPG